MTCWVTDKNYYINPFPLSIIMRKLSYKFLLTWKNHITGKLYQKWLVSLRSFYTHLLHYKHIWDDRKPHDLISQKLISQFPVVSSNLKYVGFMIFVYIRENYPYRIQQQRHLLQFLISCYGFLHNTKNMDHIVQTHMHILHMQWEYKILIF